MTWTYPRSFGENDYERIVSKESDTSDKFGVGYTLRMDNDGTVFSKVRHSISTAMAYTKVLSLNEWYHVVFVYNGVQKI